jgi:hypothetical protein
MRALVPLLGVAAPRARATPNSESLRPVTRPVGCVVDLAGRGLEGITVRPHGGFATRFPCEPTRTNANGRFEVELDACGSPLWNSESDARILVGLTFDDTTYAGIDGEYPVLGRSTVTAERTTTVALELAPRK